MSISGWGLPRWQVEAPEDKHLVEGDQHPEPDEATVKTEVGVGILQYQGWIRGQSRELKREQEDKSPPRKMLHVER